MKRFKMILMIFIVSFFSCKKEDDKLSLNEIVQTDENGNVINANNNDWQIIEYQDDLSLNSMNNALIRNHYYTFGDSLQLKDNCFIDSVEIEIIMFPNPVPQLAIPKIKITSSFSMLDIAYSYRRIGHNIGGGNAGISSTYFSNNRTYVEFPLTGIGSDRDDLELYLAILSNDTCVYYSRGNIKFN